MGFGGFDPDVIIAGVIADRVGGSRHEQWLRGALQTAGVPLLGVLPWDGRLGLPERHLGLVPAAAEPSGSAGDALADAVETHADVAARIRRGGQRRHTVWPCP